MADQSTEQVISLLKELVDLQRLTTQRQQEIAQRLSADSENASARQNESLTLQRIADRRQWFFLRVWLAVITLCLFGLLGLLMFYLLDNKLV